MQNKFPYQISLALLFEYLKHNPIGKFTNAVKGVIEIAEKQGLYSGSNSTVTWSGGRSFYNLHYQDRNILPEVIRQHFWQLLIQNIIVFGKDELEPNWPWYRVTEYGKQVFSSQGPQPYDPDGFLKDFKNNNPSVDDVIFYYLIESVLTFNHDCFNASAVMLGCASEQAILLLHETFESAIIDPNVKKRFQKSYHWTIYSKFDALRNSLEKMISSGKLPREYHEAVRSDLTGTFEIIRRYRNSAGHPNLLNNIKRETIFLNLRIFSEYISQIYNLITYFQKNPAEP